jgi:hypothetical protein
MLTQLAWEGGALDIDFELIAPSDHDAAHAFHLVSAGADLLIGFCWDAGRFPSSDEQTRERGARVLMRWADTPQGATAAVFLAQAIALLIEELHRRAGQVEEADTHHGLRKLIQRWYPLDDDDLAVQLVLAKEFRVFDDHEIRVDYGRGEMGTGYHMALLYPERTEFETVDDDENLVEIQERYAGCYLRALAILHAIKLVLPSDDFAALEEQLLPPMGMSYGLEFQLGEALAWKQVIDERWTGWAQMAAGHIVAAPGCPFPELDRLRLGTERQLREPDDRKTPATAAAVLRGWAGEITTTDLDYDLVLDALIVGYTLRRVEADTGIHNDLEQKAIADVARVAASMDVIDDGSLVLRCAAVTVVQALPRGFSQDEVAWEVLRDWGGRLAVDRSLARRDREKLDSEHALGVTFEQCLEAFDYGYAVGLSEDALPSDAA